MGSSVEVVIVTYNSAAVIRDCLASVPEGVKAVVVDNSSDDDTAEIASQMGVEVICNRANLGFGRANNVALERCEADFAMLLNPDAVLHEGTLDELLLSAQEYPDAAIIAPRISDPQGEVTQSHGGGFFSNKKTPSPMPQGDICADFLSGAAMLLRMQHFRRIGHFFDPNIFMYYEDSDICVEARKAGFSCIQAHNATVTHIGGAGSVASRRVQMLKDGEFVKSKLYFLQKHYGKEVAKRETRKILLRSLWRLIFSSRKSKAYARFRAIRKIRAS